MWSDWLFPHALRQAGALCLLAVLTVAGCARRAEDHINWTSFEPPGGDYTVLMPGNPKYVPSSEGMATWGTVVGGDTSFMTCYIELPSTRRQPAGRPGGQAARGPARLSARQRLQAAARQASRQGRVLHQQRLRLDGLEGLELVVEDDEEQVTMYRWYVSDRRLYQLLALVPKRHYTADDAVVARFFQSFRLLDH